VFLRENEILLISKKSEIEDILNKLNVGNVLHIQEKPLHNEQNFKRILITIVWNNNNKSINIMNRLHSGNNIKIIYDEPWYWKIVLCRCK
jgi:hypothetical protein